MLKNCLMVAAVLGLLGAPVMAKGHGCKGCGKKQERYIKKKVKKLNKSLKLSEEQKTKLEEVLRAKAKIRRELYKQLREKMKGHHKEAQDKIRGFLDPEQLKKYETLLEKKRKKCKGCKGKKG